MLTYRCTKKLLDRWHARAVEPRPSSTTRLGDWFGTVLADKPRHLALFVAERTLLPVVVEAAPIDGLAKRHHEGLLAVLRALQVPEAAIAAEMAEMEPIAFAKTDDRVRGGTMNDFIRMLPYGLASSSLLGESLKLAEAPCGPIGMKSPDSVTRELFALELAKGGQSRGKTVDELDELPEVLITAGENQKFVGALAEAGVRFVVIGGTAIHFHAPDRRIPSDLDLLVEPLQENRDRMNIALEAVGAPLILASPEEFAQPDKGFPEKRICNMDIFTPLKGVAFAEIWGGAIEARTASWPLTRLRVASIPAMLGWLGKALAREPSRASDIRGDILHLERISRRANRSGDSGV